MILWKPGLIITNKPIIIQIRIHRAIYMFFKGF